MTPLIIAFLVLAILCIIGIFSFYQRLSGAEKVILPYGVKPCLFTPTEKSFLDCLDSVLSPDIRVFAKIRLADLFSVEKTIDRSAWRSAFNKINGKHIDFILYNATDFRPLLAIELDDKSHDRNDRQKRDIFLNEIFATSHLPLIRFKAQKTYRAEDVAQRLNEAMG
jgi:hypothetical protein